MTQNLALNLVAEGIGIVITVFFIDRIVRWQEEREEERRWRPARQLLYRSVIWAVDDLIRDLSPPYFYREERDFDFDTLARGRPKVVITVDFNVPNAEAVFEEFLQEKYPSASSAYREAAASLSIARDRIDGMFNLSSVLGVDRDDLVAQLLELEQDVMQALRETRHKAEDTGVTFAPLARVIERVLRKAVEKKRLFESKRKPISGSS